MTNSTQSLCGLSSSRLKARWSRIQLKNALIQTENMKAVESVGYVPVCPYCLAHRPTTDMHEGLIKKGDVQGWPEEDRNLINHPINCVVLCHRCHMSEGQTTQMTVWFVEYKLSMGWRVEDMLQWIDELPFKVQTSRIAYVRKHQQTSEQDMA